MKPPLSQLCSSILHAPSVLQTLKFGPGPLLLFTILESWVVVHDLLHCVTAKQRQFNFSFVWDNRMWHSFKLDVNLDFFEEALAGAAAEAAIDHQRCVEGYDNVCVYVSFLGSQGWPPLAAGTNDFTALLQEYLPYTAVFM